MGLQREICELVAVSLLISTIGGLARSLFLLARSAWIETATIEAQQISPAHMQRVIEVVSVAAGLQGDRESQPPA